MVLTWSALVMLAYRHRGEPDFVADLVGERRLVHTPYIGFLVRHDLAGRRRRSDRRRLLEGAREREQVLLRRPPGAQSVAEIRTDMGFLPGPDARTAWNTFQR